MQPLLHGRRVLILGASGGLGRPVAQAFLDAGAHVAGTARKWPSPPSNGLVPINSDLTRRGEAERTVEAALSALGGLDVVIQLAGAFALEGSIAQTSIETFDRLLDLNLRSAFLAFRAAAPAVSHPNGRLLAIGAAAALRPGPSLSAYAPSKAALHALIQVLAAEGRSAGFTANAILPATIDTPANRAAMPDADFSRWVRPERIASLLIWLASDSGADTTGALIPLEGR